MKYIYLLAALVLLASCSQTHKLTTTVHERTDTVIVAHVDSVQVHDSTVQTDSVSLDSASIIVVLDSTEMSADTVLTVPQAKIVHDIVRAVAGKQKVKSVTINVHGLKKTGKLIEVKDSVAVQKVDSTATHTARDTVTKKADRTSYVALGITALLAIGAFIIIKFKLL